MKKTLSLILGICSFLIVINVNGQNVKKVSKATAVNNFVKVSKTNAGKTINLANTQVLEIRLPANPSTGYGWYPATSTAGNKTAVSHVAQTGNWEFEPNTNSIILGQSGMQITRFIGLSKGTSQIKLEYRRPWETDVPAIDTYTITVYSKGKYTGAYTPPVPATVPDYTPTYKSNSLPSAFTWKSQCTPIVDQGQCGSCWAFAGVGTFEANIKIVDNKTRDLSEQYLVNCDVQYYGCDGGLVPHDYWLAPKGAVYETDEPYVSGITEATGTCDPSYTYHETIDSYGDVPGYPMPTVDDIKTAIHNYGPVYVGICAGVSFSNYSGGIFVQDEQIVGVNHAVVLVGWNDNGGNNGYWILRNSWGSAWGENGYMRIKYGTSLVGYMANYIVYKGGIPWNISPTANFGAATNPGCTGTLWFADSTKNLPTSWKWYFDDGTTSTLQNPSHTYTVSGTYNVKLVATNTTGSDSTIKVVTVNLADAPAVTNASRCGSGSVTLNASGNGTLNWYDSQSGSNLVNTGTSFIIPSLSTSKTYYVQSELTQASQHIGQSDNTIGSGGYSSSYRSNTGLKFNAISPVRIVSVKVYAGTPGNRTIKLMDNCGVTLYSKVIYLNTGTNVLNLNFDVPAGTGYLLGANSQNHLYLNTTGGSYPYNLSGLISITGHNYGMASVSIPYYFYFYDWVVQQAPCLSPRIPVTATINPATVSVSVAADPGQAICPGTDVTFTASPFNGGSTPSYQWVLNGAYTGTGSETYTNATLANADNITCIMTSNAACVTGTSATSNNVNISSGSQIPASVSISSNPSGVACPGTMVTYTATSTIDGTSPSYQWQLNGINTGTDSPNYSFAALANGDAVTCIVSSNASCVTGSPATSNAIIANVSAAVPVSVDVTASPSTEMCWGEAVTFTATPTNQGTSPSYQWTVDGVNAGTNSSTYSTYSSYLLNGSVVACHLISNVACPVQADALDSVTMTINFNAFPALNITANPSGILCTGQPVTFTAVPFFPGDNPTYQWKLNGNNVGGNSSIYINTAPQNNDSIRCEMISNYTCIVGSALQKSPKITLSVNECVASINIMQSSPSWTICQGTSVTFTATAFDGGTNPAYQWKLNGANVGTNSSVYVNNALPNGAQIKCVLTSNMPYVTGNPATSGTITMTVYPMANPSVSVTASPSTYVCPGTLVIFIANGTNKGTTPTYQWKLNGNTVGGNSSMYTNSSLVNGDQVSCVMTSNADCLNFNPATSNVITMTVNPTWTGGVSITANPGSTVCANTTVIFTATPSNPGTHTYQWKLNGANVGSNSSIYYLYGPAMGNTMSCVMKPAGCTSWTTVTSNSITMTVNPTLTNISISANPSGIACAGQIITFTASPTNPGATPTYQWLLNGNIVVGYSSTYANSTLTNSDNIRCVMTSSAPCITNNPVTSSPIYMMLNQCHASVYIDASTSYWICPGTSVIFTANATNGGTPTYQWKINGNNVGTNSSTYLTTSLNDLDQVSCVMTSSLYYVTGNPATSSVITMHLYPSYPSAASIIASPSTPICPETTVSFTATASNPGNNPTYQWQLNGNNVGGNSSVYSNASLLNNDQVKCVLTSNAFCPTPNPATSNTISIAINSYTGSASIAANPSTIICSGTNVIFNATLSTGGANSYQWKLNGLNVGSNSSIYSNAGLYTGDAITCEITPQGCANWLPVTSNALIMTVNPLIDPGVSISANPSSGICSGADVTFTGIPINGGSAPTYLWQKNGLDVGSNSPIYVSNDLTSGDQVNCIMTSNADCLNSGIATSNTVQLFINTPSSDPTGISVSANPACYGSTTVLSVLGGSLGVGADWVWYEGNCGGSAIDTGNSITVYPTLTTRYYVRAVNDCNITNCMSTVVTVMPDVSTPVFIQGPLSTRIPGAGTETYSATAMNTTGITYSLSPAQAGSININTGEVTWDAAYCGQATITASAAGCNGPVTADHFVLTDAPAPLVTVVDHCGYSVLTASDYSGDLLWSTNETTPSITNYNAGVYSVTQTINGCTSASGNGTAAPISIPTAPLLTVTNYCGNSTLTASNYTGTLAWSDAGNGNPRTVTSGSFTVNQTINGCVSLESNQVTVSPIAIPSAPTLTVTNNCGNSTLTASNYTGTLTWSDAGNGNPRTVTSGSFTVTQTVNGCVSAASNLVTASPVTIPSAPVVTASDSCGYSFLMASNYSGTLLWSNSETTFDIIVTDAGTYTVTQTVNGCTSLEGSAIVSPKTVPPAPVIDVTDQCGNSVLTASNYTGTLFWSTSETTPSITVTDAGEYFVTQIAANGCASEYGYGNAAPLTVPPAPVLAVVNNCGNSTLTVSNYTGTLTWSDAGSGNPRTVTSGSYTVTQTVNGCVSIENHQVTAEPYIIPVVTASASPALVCRGSSSTLSATGAGANAAYSWSNGLGTGSSKTVTPTGTTVFYVTGTDANSCSNTATVTVTVTPTVAITPVSAAICTGYSATLTASGANTYKWNTNANTTSITVSPTATTTYTVTGTTNSCTNTANVVVTVYPKPIVTVTASPTTICSGSSSTITATGAANYNWSGGIGSGNLLTVTPTATTIYTVTGTDANGCTNTAKVTVTVNALPTITLSPSPASVCTGASSTISASGASTYVWSGNLGTGNKKTVTPAFTTVYTVSGTATTGCVNTASATLTVYPIPVTTATASPQAICKGSSSTLTANGATTYKWSTNATTNPITVAPTSTTTYKVTGTSNGCSSTASVVLTVNPKPTITATASPASIVKGSSSILTASGGVSYTWSNNVGAGNPVVVAPAATTTYIVTGTNANGCSNTGSVKVTVTASFTSSLDEDTEDGSGQILDNFPDPFSNTTTLRFMLAEKTHVKLNVYNISGSLITTLYDADIESNQLYQVEFNGAGLPQGMYFYQIITDKKIMAGKMMLIKE